MTISLIDLFSLIQCCAIFSFCKNIIRCPASFPDVFPYVQRINKSHKNPCSIPLVSVACKGTVMNSKERFLVYRVAAVKRRYVH